MYVYILITLYVGGSFVGNLIFALCLVSELKEMFFSEEQKKNVSIRNVLQKIN